MPEVLSLRNEGVVRSSPTSVYVGRPSKWGNPFIIGVHGTREQVVDKYSVWLCENDDIPLTMIVKELRGKDLVCWCAPYACHADVLLRLANG